VIFGFDLCAAGQNRCEDMIKKRLPPRTLAEMSALLALWESGGQSRAEFCREHDIPVWTFQYWQRRCLQADKAGDKAGASAGFKQILPPPEGSSGGFMVRIRHPNGTEILLDGRVEVTFVRELLRW
jgi:hypothetical protein